MGGVARSQLVCAVTEAGGFGFLGMVRESPDLIREEVRLVRAGTDRKFGVNVIPAATDPALLDAQIATCIELAVPVVGLFWDISQPLMQRLHKAGILVVCQVGSLEEAWEAQNAGADILIAQGVEAGGHVRGKRPLALLLPEIVAMATVPVLAAGGIVDGGDVATALTLGAQGAVLGTALIATHESFAHPYHKQRLVDAAEGETVLTEIFHINWPMGANVRVLANSVTRGERGDPFAEGKTVIGDEEGRPIYLFSTDSPLRSMTGDFEAMALYAGAGVGRIDAIAGAAERLQRIAADTVALLDSGALPPRTSQDMASPTCYADEANDAYMGYMDRATLLAALNELLEAERAGARVTLETIAQTEDPGLKQLVTQVHRDEVRWCGVLMGAVKSMQATPSTQTGAFYGMAMDIADLPQRLTFLNRGQGWVVKKLKALVPKIRDERIQADLAAMLASHKDNIRRVEAHPYAMIKPSSERSD